MTWDESASLTLTIEFGSAVAFFVCPYQKLARTAAYGWLQRSWLFLAEQEINKQTYKSIDRGNSWIVMR